MTRQAAPGSHAGTGAAGHWTALRARVQARLPVLPIPPAAGAGLCACCRRATRRGFLRCIQCAEHAECAPGMLADAVEPVAYAVKGGALARDLWLYKSREPGAAQAAAGLLALLLVYLHDRAGPPWRRAGLAPPTHLCAVPSCCGREGTHPLQALVSGCLALPWTALAHQPGPGAWGRCLDSDRFRATEPLTGARVLLLDDTWVSGGTAQSAAVALKRAGSRSVVTVVLGRHLAADGLPPAAARWRPQVNRLGP